MQLKETGAGEVTVWLAEMLVTIEGTDEEEAAQRKEREGTNNTCKRYPAIPTVALSPNGSHYKWTVVSRADSTQSVGVLPNSQTARVGWDTSTECI